MKRKLFFGEFLINRGLITEEDMVAALEDQRRETPAFEKMCLRLGLLTMKEVFYLLTAQADSGLSFPEVAVREGHLGVDQVSFVLNAIDGQRPTIGDVLVKQGRLDQRTMAAELDAFLEQTRQYQDIQELLANIALFRRLDEPSLRSLSYIAEKQVFSAGQPVVVEGEPADCFYAVAEGYLRITKDNPHGDGEPIYIGNIGRNDVFGESAIFEEAVRNAHVGADTDTVLLRIGRRDFLQFLQDHPASSQSVLIFIIHRLLNKLSLTNKELAYERQHFMPQQDVESVLEEFFSGPALPVAPRSDT